MSDDRLIFLLFFCTLLSGCASPAQQFDNKAARYEFEKLALPGQIFTHISYRNRVANKEKRLHIYIEGDGIPWLTRTQVSADPTPRKALMLELMALDPQTSLYLGRPCYFGQAQSPACHPLLWTHQRYSQQVVLSMVAALKQYLVFNPYDKLVFFGHSGGGTLAMLIAPYLKETIIVVTLAANLDIDAWADHHGYNRLEHSLNPAVMPSLAPHIMQVHYAGKNDHVVPTFVIKKGLVNQIKKQFHLLESADHTCCWDQIWHQILNKIQVAKTK